MIHLRQARARLGQTRGPLEGRLQGSRAGLWEWRGCLSGLTRGDAPANEGAFIRPSLGLTGERRPVKRSSFPAPSPFLLPARCAALAQLLPPKASILTAKVPALAAGGQGWSLAHLCPTPAPPIPVPCPGPACGKVLVNMH